MRLDTRGDQRGVSAAASLVIVLALAVAAGCSSPTTTSVRVKMTWPAGLSVDQLVVSVVPAVPGATSALAGPAPRPEKAGAPLSSGQDVIVLLKDQLDGRSVLCRVSGLLKGKLVQLADSPPVTVKRGQLVTCTVALPDGAVETDLPNGAACRDGRQCTSQACADGLCCDHACTDTCMACNLPASPGTCSPIPAGSPPSDAAQCPNRGATSCGTDGLCDGHGACRNYPEGTVCANGTCNVASIEGGKICDGKGACVAGPAVTCAPFLCDPGTNPASCRMTCTSSADCVTGRPCENGSCGKKANGAACATADQCQSAHCAGGLCCDQACDGACVTCAQPNSPGICRPVAAGAPDPNGQCRNSRDTDPTSCGDSGTCDGNGACAPYAANTVCRPAMCSDPQTLARAATCDGAGTCVDGTALHCDPFGCRNGNCNSTCTGDSDCAMGQSCDTAAMSCGLKGNGQSCGGNGECASGVCADGLCCNEACDGPCRSCALASSPGVCKNVAPGAADPHKMCAASTVSSCGTDGLCDGNGMCRRYLAGTVCQAATCGGSTRTLAATCDGQGTCVAGYTTNCSPYRCNGTACFLSCSGDGDCQSPLVCLGGACGQKPNGLMCGQSAECESGSCVNGTCCASASCGSCQACNVAGSMGRCAPVPAMTLDPSGTCMDKGAASCGTDGRCDGAGGCHRYAVGTTCVAGACTGSTLTNDAACDGAGTCVPGSQQPCAPYLCGATGNCLTTCATSADCLAPAQCQGGSCGLKPQGVACGAPSECASGYCTDGVCCGQASCGSCQACNVAGKPGQCQFVPAGADDPHGMCRTDAPSTCGQNGKCDGGGHCQRYDAGTACLPPSCAGRSLTPPGLCGTSGTCLPPAAPTDCTPYSCVAGACATSCAQDSDCASPYICLGSICKKKAPGAACGSSMECDSGYCVNNVCCGSASCGMCKACNVPGFAGTCAPVAAGTDSGGACPVDLPTSCGHDGTCDGAGACRYYNASVVCAPATCTTPKKSTNPKTCNGAGNCASRGSVNCQANDCDPTTGLCP